MIMKYRLFSLFLALALTFSLFAACSSSPASQPNTSDSAESTEDSYALRVGALKGPTGMGMAKLISDQKDLGRHTFEIYGAPTDITAALIAKELDVAAVPANVAAVIHNRTQGEYLVAAINTLGVLYIVENGETLTKLSDLEGKTLYATGQGSTPEYMLNYILEKNGLLDKVTVEWKTEHSELATLVASGEVQYAMLPEPNVTTVLSKKDTLRVAINLTEEWNKTGEGQAVQGCLLVSKKAIEEHKAVVDAFLADYQASVEYVNGHVKEASELIAALGIVPAAAVAERAIPRCNIVFIEGDAMIASLKSFYAVLYNANPSSVGGTLPTDSLYYKR
ncbi:MAG: ABC transporter substrate-binding protein [Ruminococcaceae bacterium]|nr:ABC transporter substrate-binding protein [Oscillospiraceae bacterium]